MSPYSYSNDSGSYFRTETERVYNPDTGWQTVPKTTVILNQFRSSTSFTCSNGNVRGNFKSPNPVHFEKVKTTVSDGILHNDSNDVTGSFTHLDGCGISAPPLIFGVPQIRTDFDNLYNDCLEGIDKAYRGDLDLSVDLFEAHQVNRMFKDVLKLTKFVRSLSPRNWANNWLQYQYGWRPLVSSIYGVANEFRRPIEEGIQIYDQRKSKSYKDNAVLTSSPPGIFDSWTTEGTLRCNIKVRCRPATQTIDNLARFSSLNPASVAWELCPYSFVADWVFNVGGYLRGMETAYLGDMRFLDGFVTKTYRASQTGKRSGMQDLGGGATSIQVGSRIVTYKFKDRTILTGFPRPVFPRFEINLGSQRFLSAASLLKQAVDRKIR